MITSAVRCIETAFARCNKDWEGPSLYHRLRTLISSAEAMKAKKQQCRHAHASSEKNYVKPQFSMHLQNLFLFLFLLPLCFIHSVFLAHWYRCCSFSFGLVCFVFIFLT